MAQNQNKKSRMKAVKIIHILIASFMAMSGILGAVTDKAYAAATTVTLKYGSSINYGSAWYGHTSIKWVTHIDGKAVDLDDVAGVSRSYAYCVQPTADAPPQGTYNVTVVDDDDTGKIKKMRKFIYYSPGSYGYAKVTKKRWFKNYSTNESYAIAHLALSWIYDGYDNSGIWGGAPSSWINDAKDMVEDLKNLDGPPDDYEIFWVKVSGKQDVFGAFYHTEYGKIKLKKSSALTKVTNGNRSYNLEGAEFTLYTDKDCKEVAKFKDGSKAVLKTKSDGTTPEYDIETGEYYLKETKAPKGYALDTKVHAVEVKNSKTTTYSAQDIPRLNLITTLLQKLDKNSGSGASQGDASMEGAVYRFDYYDGMYDNASAAEASGDAIATWYFETDRKGVIYGDGSDFAKGYTSSKLYTDADGNPGYPIGTYVIQEVKAPEGYLLSKEKKVARITDDGKDSVHVSTYNQKTNSVEVIIKGGVKVSKIDHDRNTAVPQGDATLEGAEFTIYNKSEKAVTVNGREYAKDAAAMVIKTDAAGMAETASNALPYGTYLIRETKAPAGYHLNESWSKTFSIRTDGEVKDYTKEATDENVQRGGVKLQKIDQDLKRAYAQGDATLEGAEITIYNQSAQSVIIGGKEYAKGAAVMTIKTDANGAAATANNVLPYGTYSAKETKPSTGYLLNSSWGKSFEIREPNKLVDISESTIEEPVIRGGVKLSKIDNDLDEAYAQGDATLAGAEFTIYNKSAHNVYVDGKEHKTDAAVLVIKTNEQGIAASAANALPYGTYLIKETKPSKGYLLNAEWSKTFQIRENGKIIDLTEDKVREAVERGGVQIVKRDKELAKSEALGGATLEGIVMTIKNVSAHDVVVRKDIGNITDKVDWKNLVSKKELFEKEQIKRVKSGEDVGKIITHWNEEKKAYTAETLADDLPYGTYTIRESKTNNSYQRTDKTEHKFEVRKDGTLYAYDSEGMDSILTFDDYVYRSDMQGTKIGDGDSKRFSYVPFKITSVANGETHVVVADNNGYFSTKDRRTKDEIEEDEDADTARKINPFDDLLEAKEIKKEDLQKRASEMLMGVWFGTGEFGSKAEMDSSVGALPYDSYVIEEIPFDGNEGYTLQKFFFTVDEKSRNGFVDLETITNDYKEIPEIGTEASVDGKNADITPAKEITLIDTIEYSGLKKLTKYIAKGKLMDKATGEVIKDASGKEITAEKEFTTVLSSGRVKVEFKFDGRNMHGKETVVFETVYDTEGHIIAKHEDINDEGQTVTWEHLKPSYEMYKIRTTRAPSKGDKYGFFAQDEVEYEVHIENTGNVVLTMDVSDKFTEGEKYFTTPKLKDVKFDGEGNWNNKKADEKAEDDIANITINPGENAIVTYTAVVKDEAKEYLAAAAKDSDSLDAKGKDTNMAYQKNRTDDKDGYRNEASCENVTYPNPDKPDEPRSLEPKKDVAQTPVQKPEIGTTLTDEQGNKEVVASEKTVLVDTVEYKGLDKTKWYVIEGTLMVKDTADPLVEHGKEITVTSEPFRPGKESGKEDIRFVIDTTGLEGKELVAFETAYHLDGFEKDDDISSAKRTQIAEHKDINDKGQTVRIIGHEEPAPPVTITKTPDTGNPNNLFLYVLLVSLSMTGVTAFAVKEHFVRIKKMKEDRRIVA